MNEQSLFTEALDISDPSARAAFLDRACGGDAALRRRVERLLRRHQDAGCFLERPVGVPDETAAFAPAGEAEAIGTVIGPYTLREQIGEGGMGLVFVAEQTEPVRRKVALKVIKPGMDTRQVVARFEAERQALALMDHPNIAKVFDAGATDSGRPFFVMELVRGLPITDYCDQVKMSVRERMALFAQVCQAVQHAHQKGIIHRDLKPSNVLVAVHDVAPVTKVIDFGIAKAVGQSLGEKTVYTAVSQFVGTPLYMSPEQAGQSSLDVDTRTDVYALGVLLYELLTGTTPIDPETVRKAGLDQVRRIIREDEPPRPSARASTLKAAALSTVADKRGADPWRLVRLMRGELDWVVMKCLEKDRNRRYESASALAADVRRFLADEAVAACPPSAGYRLRKLARRNKATLVTAAVVALALVAGTTVSVWQAVRADEARRDADERLREEKRAKVEAHTQSQLAAENYRRARAAVKQMLTRVATDEVGRIPAMVEIRRKLLEDAAAFYTELLKLGPTDAETCYERGKVYALLFRNDEARRDFETALGLDPDHLECHVALGILCDSRRALAHFTRAVEIDRDGRPARGQQISRQRLYYLMMETNGLLGNKEECLKWLRSFQELAPPPAGNTSWGMAKAYLRLGEPQEALAHARRAVELAPAHPRAHLSLAECLRGVGDYEGAMAAINEAIRVTPHPSDSASAESYGLRAGLHRARGNYRLAAGDYTRVLELVPPAGSSHHYRSRAACYFHLGDYPKTLADVAVAVEVTPGYGSMITGVRPGQIAACPDPAFRQLMLDQASRGVELSKGVPDALTARAALYAAMGEGAKARADWAAALAAYQRRRAELESKLGSERDEGLKQLASIHASLGLSLLEDQQYAAAEPFLHECLSIREKLIPEDWRRFNAASMLGGALLGQQKYVDAEPLLLAGYEGMKAREAKILPDGRFRLVEAAERVVKLYAATDRPEKAAEWRAKLPRAVAPPPRPIVPKQP